MITKRLFLIYPYNIITLFMYIICRDVELKFFGAPFAPNKLLRVAEHTVRAHVKRFNSSTRTNPPCITPYMRV